MNNKIYTFKDLTVEQYTRRQLRKNIIKDITLSDLAKIDKIVINGEVINTLEDLPFFPTLKHLDLANCMLTGDLIPLSK